VTFTLEDRSAAYATVESIDPDGLTLHTVGCDNKPLRVSRVVFDRTNKPGTWKWPKYLFPEV